MFVYKFDVNSLKINVMLTQYFICNTSIYIIEFCFLTCGYEEQL